MLSLRMSNSLPIFVYLRTFTRSPQICTAASRSFDTLRRYCGSVETIPWKSKFLGANKLLCVRRLKIKMKQLRSRAFEGDGTEDGSLGARECHTCLGFRLTSKYTTRSFQQLQLAHAKFKLGSNFFHGTFCRPFSSSQPLRALNYSRTAVHEYSLA